ncbi:hypothetical protein BG003_009759 [Podila horticola]|nr:hypothetical protein BG003_009759 [Podila horticola]
MGHYTQRSILNPIAFLCQYYLLLISILPPTTAQTTFTPVNAYGSSSVYIEGVAFYIQAGAILGTYNYTPQSFSIDLSVNWSVNRPAYIQLADGPTGIWYPSALLVDNVSWVSIRNKTLVNYNLKTGTKSVGLPFGTSDLVNVDAYVDSGTGELVVPSLTSPSAPSPVYRSSNFNVTAVAEPTCALLGGLHAYAMAWSTSQQAAFAFGGASATGNLSATLMRLNRQSSTWSPISVDGGPSARQSACMVAIEGGNRLVVFGGQVDNGMALNDIYIYDVLASKWMRGQDGGARTYHVCAASSGQLIAWGGYSNVAAGASVPVLTSVYDLATNTWQQQYTTSSVGTNKSLPVSAIAGACAGVIVVVTILVFLMVKRRRRGAKKQAEPLFPFQAASPSSDKDALLSEAAFHTKVTVPVHDPQTGWSKSDAFESSMSEYRPPAPQGLSPATDPRSPQYIPVPIGVIYQGQQQQSEYDHLQQMQLEERLALEQLIETHRVQMETQQGQMEAQNKRLQLLMEQRRAYQVGFGGGRGPQVTDSLGSVEYPDARNPQLI